MKTKVFLHVRLNGFKELDISPFPSDMSSYGMGVLFEERELDVSPPPYNDIVNGTVKTLREKQNELRAESEKKCTEIEQKIQSLLCIENKPSDV